MLDEQQQAALVEELRHGTLHMAFEKLGLDPDANENYNPFGNKTANGVLIVEGLRVFDNNLDVGTVRRMGHSGDWSEDGERFKDFWYEVELDYIPEAPDYSGNRHGGYRTMNGERLSTRHPNTRVEA